MAIFVNIPSSAGCATGAASSPSTAWRLSSYIFKVKMMFFMYPHPQPFFLRAKGANSRFQVPRPACVGEGFRARGRYLRPDHVLIVVAIGQRWQALLGLFQD